MRMYIWNYIDKLTNNYHSGGGAVVMASSLERAKSLLVEKGAKEVPEASEEYEVYANDERVFIFADAGCC